MRAPVDTITAPPFLTHLKWVNVPTVRMDKQLGKPVLIEFWDFCRPNSLRTLPYVKAWHERYREDGLGVIGIHSPGFDISRERQAVRDAVTRLGVEYPVLVDPNLEMWEEYGNQGWPARYLFDQRGVLFDYHYGEGAYRDTELAIQELLGCQREPLAPLRPEDDPDARIVVPSEDREGAYCGPYEAGAVWAIFDGAGVASINGSKLTISHPGAHLLIEHDRHSSGVLDLRVEQDLHCLATCFTAGLA
jgi:thiol-disulfide isomerase/thioredoxin